VIPDDGPLTPKYVAMVGYVKTVQYTTVIDGPYITFLSLAPLVRSCHMTSASSAEHFRSPKPEVVM